MSDDPTRTMSSPEEDDWETVSSVYLLSTSSRLGTPDDNASAQELIHGQADLSTFVKPSLAKAAPPPMAPNLRPSAPAFQPRTSGASPSANEQSAPIRLAPRIRSNEGRGRTSPSAAQADKGDDWFSSRPPVTNRQLWESGWARSA